MRLRRLLRGYFRVLDMVAEAVLGIVSGVAICRPGGQVPQILLVSS